MLCCNGPPSDKLQIGHWAYMLQTRPGMASWKSLPGAGGFGAGVFESVSGAQNGVRRNADHPLAARCRDGAGLGSLSR